MLHRSRLATVATFAALVAGAVVLPLAPPAAAGETTVQTAGDGAGTPAEIRGVVQVYQADDFANGRFPASTRSRTSARATSSASRTRSAARPPGTPATASRCAGGSTAAR